MASLPKFTLRTFDEVQRDFDDTVAQMRKTFDPKLRVKFLRKLRALIEEADALILAER